MDAAATKLDKFEGVDFRRWQKKKHFLLSSMSVVCVMTTHIPEYGGDDETVKQIRKIAKWDNDDYVCRDSKHTLKYFEELTLVELGNHLRIEESLMVQDTDKPKSNCVADPSIVNMVEHNNSSWYNDNKGKRKYHDNIRVDPNKKSKVTCWRCGKSGHLKKELQRWKSWQQSQAQMDDDVAWWVDSGATVHVCKDRCWSKTFESLNDGSILHMGNESTSLMHERGYVDLRFNIVNDNIGSAFMSTSKQNDSILWHARLGHVYFKRMHDMSKDGTDKGGEYMDTLYFQSIGVIYETVVPYTPQQNGISERKNRPNDSVSINSTIESRDAIFDENSLSSVPRPSLRIPDGTEDIVGSVVPEEVTEEFVQQPKPELRKSKRNRTSKNHGPEFQLYLIERTRDEISDQHSYCFNVEDDPKTFDEAMKSQDVAFWKEATNDEINFIMGNNTWVLADLPPGCKPLGFK
nr:zinc finger, CCHC-type [Tanacetum cinerariifolium]